MDKPVKEKSFSISMLLGKPSAKAGDLSLGKEKDAGEKMAKEEESDSPSEDMVLAAEELASALGLKNVNQEELAKALCNFLDIRELSGEPDSEV